MTDIRAWLDQGKTLADRATEGPWAAWTDQDGTEHMQGRLMVGNAAAVIPEGESWVEGVDINPVAHVNTGEDRAFIADARSRLPQALDALQAVLDMHKPIEFVGHSATWLHCTQGCATYPCATVRAITDAIGAAMREMPINQVFNVPPAHDPVNNPAHYTQYPVEVIELAECLNYNRGNILKYVCRAGLKDPSKELEDLEKALWYVQREIARVKKARDGETEMVSETFFNGQNKVIREDIFSDTSQSLKERRFTHGDTRGGKLNMWDVTNGEWVTFNVREWRP